MEWEQNVLTTHAMFVRRYERGCSGRYYKCVCNYHGESQKDYNQSTISQYGRESVSKEAWKEAF